MNVCALLESMWGWGGYCTPGEDAPRFFRISRQNFSGKRLYRICGDVNLIVTNSCRVIQESANHHGEPDPIYVAENLKKALTGGCDLFLICGKVALQTYKATGLNLPKVIFMDHPAARRWSNEKLDAMTVRVAEELGYDQPTI